ncbi:MAG TPA: exonuclease SbcCD subunit D [Solirubrobacteraceae bacterium]|jgi:DNA repair exonuclease SbcCD nuclease subunit|nr:exonuclease SbcCD subunit D [Solirubrobacteraceae bacterium]
MRICHLADTHLGFRQLHRVDDAGRNERELDIYRAWNAAIETIVELEPDAVVHAGDLFDSYHPSTAALGVALDGLRRLNEVGIPTVVIAGNHSTPRVAAAEHIFGVLARFGGVHVVYGGTEVIEIPARDGSATLAVHAIAHDNEPEVMAAALRAARPASEAQFNVLMAHMGLDGLGNVVGAEAGSVTLSGEELAGAGEFDYVALGHLHKFAPARENAAYSGSLERLSWADDAPHKGVVEVDLAAGRMSADYLRLHPVPTRAHITLPAIDAAQTDDLTAALLARAADAGEALAGAMVRLAIRNVSAADWNAVDHKAVAAAYSACLHFEREPQLTGQAAAAAAPAPALRDFLLAWAAEHAPKAPAEQLVSRAEAFLAQADQTLIAEASR